MSIRIKVTYHGYSYNAKPFWDIPDANKDLFERQKELKDMFKVLINIFKSCLTDPREYNQYDMLPQPDQQKIANNWYDLCMNYQSEKEEPNVVY